MRLRNQIFWAVAVIGVILDQLTKWWVVQTFALGDTIPLWSGVFHFTYVTNKGAAFSLFSDNGEWLRWLSLLVSLGLAALGVWGEAAPTVGSRRATGFILSGAVGNGIDRFLSGEVVDFLDFRLIRFPIFNLADVCINIGIVCLVIAAFRAPSNGKGNAGGPEKVAVLTSPAISPPAGSGELIHLEHVRPQKDQGFAKSLA
jgi:signal peptidase II